jgi:hypothetical protein
MRWRVEHRGNDWREQDEDEEDEGDEGEEKRKMYMDNRRLQQTARRSSIQTDVDTHVAMDNGHGTWTPPYSQRLRALSLPPILTNIITRISLISLAYFFSFHRGF